MCVRAPHTRLVGVAYNTQYNNNIYYIIYARSLHTRRPSFIDVYYTDEYYYYYYRRGMVFLCCKR